MTSAEAAPNRRIIERFDIRDLGKLGTMRRPAWPSQGAIEAGIVTSRVLYPNGQRPSSGKDQVGRTPRARRSRTYVYLAAWAFPVSPSPGRASGIWGSI